MSALYAISPLDGRYASKVDALRPIMSEAGLLHHRVEVEVAWVIALSKAGFAELPAFSDAAVAYLNQIVANFGEEDAQAIKDRIGHPRLTPISFTTFPDPSGRARHSAITLCRPTEAPSRAPCYPARRW